jgi:hypothetical protein
MATSRKGAGKKGDSPAVPLECSAFTDIELGTVGTSETEPPGRVQIGLIDFEKQCERFSKR